MFVSDFIIASFVFLSVSFEEIYAGYLLFGMTETNYWFYASLLTLKIIAD